MELPRVRRYRKGGIDRLYVEHSAAGETVTLGWADTDTGDITIQVPGADARVDIALENWATNYPEDDLASHPPGWHVLGIASAWQREIDDLEHEILQLQAMRDMALYQRDQFRKGASGEAAIGVELNTLYRHGWGLLHSIPTANGLGDIDHLAIGPGGVWSVNSKKHPAGQIVVDGDTMRVGRVRVDYIASARREAAGVARALASAGAPTTVRAMVVLDIPRDRAITTHSSPTDVVIATRSTVVAHLRKLAPILDQADINRVFGVARQAGTWAT